MSILLPLSLTTRCQVIVKQMFLIGEQMFYSCRQMFHFGKPEKMNSGFCKVLFLQCIPIPIIISKLTFFYSVDNISEFRCHISRLPLNISTYFSLISELIPKFKDRIPNFRKSGVQSPASPPKSDLMRVGKKYP